MLGNITNHQSIRNVIIAFGTLFNNVRINRLDANGNIVKEIRLPIQFSSKKKVFQQLFNPSSLDESKSKVKMEVPRLGYELNSINPGPADRRLNSNTRLTKKIDDITGTTAQVSSSSSFLITSPTIKTFQDNLDGYVFEVTSGSSSGLIALCQGYANNILTLDIPVSLSSGTAFKINDTASRNVSWMRVPCTFAFTLYMAADTSTDAYATLEQILPYFDTDFSISINDPMGLVTDLTITMASNPAFNNSYEGFVGDTQITTFEIPFNVRGYLYRPITVQRTIKKVIINAIPVTDVDNLPSIDDILEASIITAEGIKSGTITSAGSNYVILSSSNLASSSDSYIGSVVTLNDGSQEYQRICTAYDPDLKQLTVHANWPTLPVAGWNCVIAQNQDNYTGNDPGQYTLLIT